MTQIKTLARGLLKASGVFRVGEGILYAAPHPAQQLTATVGKKSALITAFRLYNNFGGQSFFRLAFVRYDAQTAPEQRPLIYITPLNTALNPRQLRVDTVPLVLEEGDMLVGGMSGAVPNNVVGYVLSGVERDV